MMTISFANENSSLSNVYFKLWKLCAFAVGLLLFSFDQWRGTFQAGELMVTT